MLNKKGMLNIHFVLAFIIIIFIIIMSISIPLVNKYYQTNAMFQTTTDNINEKNSISRIYEKIHQNMSVEGPLIYSDLGTDYQIAEVSTDYDTKTYTFGNYQYVNVYNKTDIQINLGFTSDDSENPGYYNVSVLYKGNVINEFNNQSGNLSITIPSNYLYDESSDTTHYGEYEVVISEFNGISNGTVEYQELTSREINLYSENGTNFDILINQTDGQITTKRMGSE